MKTGLEQIAEELTEQINSTKLHYKDCKNKELLFGALSYLNAAIYGESVGNEDWPFSQTNWQYEGYVESLKKAGTFIVLELDRLQKS